jgi:hypothetical protein
VTRASSVPGWAGSPRTSAAECGANAGRDGEFPELDLEDAEHEVKASRGRQAKVDKMLDMVAASLTARQQQIYDLVLRQDIRGQALAAQLGISEKEANDATYENQILLSDGFGAYVLASDGRRYCANLGQILDQSGWDGVTFTRVLRLRVLRHLDNCPKLCDNCPTCNPQKWKLIALYTPVTIPFLIGAELRDRIYQLIQHLTAPQAPGSHDAGSKQNAGSVAQASAQSATTANLTADIVSEPPAPAGADGAAKAVADRARSRHSYRRVRKMASAGHGAGGAAAVVVVAAMVTGIVLAASGPGTAPAHTAANAAAAAPAGAGTNCGSDPLNPGGNWEVVVASGHMDCAAAVQTIKAYGAGLKG